MIESPGETASSSLSDRESISQEAIESEGKNIRVDEFMAEEIMKSYGVSYPHKISEISLINTHWAMKVYGHWLYWADGRLLPEALIIKADEYTPYTFFSYPEELGEFHELREEEKEHLDHMQEERKTVPFRRHPELLNRLWRIDDKDSSWARVKTTYFFGLKLQIHRDLLEDLAKVEEEIQNIMTTDREVSQFIRSIKRIDGYNWRPIAETETLSSHSYGIAIDFVLDNLSGKEIYWLWAKNKGLRWYDIPYDQRFSPPTAFIKIFEKYGFI